MSPLLSESLIQSGRISRPSEVHLGGRTLLLFVLFKGDSCNKFVIVEILTFQTKVRRKIYAKRLLLKGL